MRPFPPVFGLLAVKATNIFSRKGTNLAGTRLIRGSCQELMHYGEIDSSTLWYVFPVVLEVQFRRREKMIRSRLVGLAARPSPPPLNIFSNHPGASHVHAKINLSVDLET